MNRSYEGPAIDSGYRPDGLPDDLFDLLAETNGYVGMNGSLHFRGIGDVPDWHSLERVWRGAEALHERYPALLETDIPFAQDCLGDQFLLRDGKVFCLQCETGEIEKFGSGLSGFVLQAMADPEKVCGAAFVKRLADEGHELQPGELIHVYPPMCFEEAADGVSLRAVPGLDLLDWHADLANQLAEIGDGSRVKIEITPLD